MQINGPRDPSHVRVATYNTRDLGDADKPMAEERDLAAVMQHVNADVWLLQEVKSRDTLDRFVAGRLPHGDFPYRAFFETNDPASHHLAILSRYPMMAQRTHGEEQIGVRASGAPMHFSRDVASVKINVQGSPLRFYDIHFMRQPKRDDSVGEAAFKDDVRRAEARATTKIVLRDFPSERVVTASKKKHKGKVSPAPAPTRLTPMPKALYVIGGDANALPRSPELGALTRWTTPRPMVNPLDGTSTVTHPGTQTQTDYLLFSPDLADAVVPGSTRVYDGPFSDTASDHRVVYADIDVGKLQG